jgi:pyrroline-5-carboxylate reductase
MIDVSVIGCGNMGGALLRGLAEAGGYRLTAYDVDPDALAGIEAHCDRTTTDLDDVRDSGIVVLAVKPDIVPVVLADLDLRPEQTLVTIAAGVSRATVAAETDATVVRIMPNLAAEARMMAAAVAWDEPDESVATMLSDLGAYVVVDEDLMHVTTALNGSGPAFVFYLIQAMQARAVEEGLDPEDARTLAAQTFKGAAETVLRSDRELDALIDAVCSPGGTTIEGMEVLFDSDVDAVVGDALTAARRRSEELAGDDTE